MLILNRRSRQALQSAPSARDALSASPSPAGPHRSSTPKSHARRVRRKGKPGATAPVPASVVDSGRLPDGRSKRFAAPRPQLSVLSVRPCPE